MDWMSIIAVCVALMVALTMVILYKKRVIDADVIAGVNQAFQDLPVVEGNGVFGKIAEYSKVAVAAVEQMVKTGKIDRNDDARKEAAMQIVANAAKVDDVPFGVAEQDAASTCIEAEVQLLPRNQKPPDAVE